MEKADLKRVVNSVVRRYPISCGLALSKVEFELTKEIETASISPSEKNEDLIKLEVNPDFFDLLSFSEKGFIIAHEALHIAFKHVDRAEKKILKSVNEDYDKYCKKTQDEKKRKRMKWFLLNKYHNIWNMATDACINALLKKDNYYSFPNKVVDPKTGETMKFVDMDLGLVKSAEYIYDYLVLEDAKKEENQKDFNDFDSSFSNEPSSGVYSGIDSHKGWMSSSIEKAKNQENNDLTDSLSTSESTSSDCFEDENIDEVDELKKDEEKRNSIAEQNKNSSFERIIPKYEPKKKIDPILSWQEILKGHVRNKSVLYWSKRRLSRAHPNSRLEERFIESIPPVELILDTSGSISTELLKRFITEVYNILNEIVGENISSSEINLKIGCFSTSFTGFRQIRSKEDLDSFEKTIGGGTDFEVAATSFTKSNESIKIVFTDGYLGDNPKTYVPDILWIVFGEKPNFTPLGGKVIKVDEKSLDTTGYHTSKRKKM